MEKVKFSAPLKIIVSGEHAVVYGYPALVAAIDKRIYLELKRTKNSFAFDTTKDWHV